MQVKTSTPTSPNLSNSILHSLSGGTGLTLMACLAIFAVLAILGNSPNRKNKIASGYWGGRRELNSAKRRALKQIKDRKRNAVAAYIGTKNSRANVSDNQRIYLPDIQRGLAVIGAPGSGKTFSVIDPALRSLIELGYPIILYDFKYPTQSSRIAAYAADLGYEINIFAPGFKESRICNPLDFLRDESDAETARQIAAVLNKNFKLAQSAPEDPFFSAAGDQLTEGVLMLGKASKFPDLMTCQTILGLDKLPQRIENADLNPWVKASFGQIISVKDSEKTVASIQGTANNNFNRFTKPGIVGAFTGNTNLPLDLSGRQMLIIGLDRERRDVVGPLAATILHMIVNRNVTQKRLDPLIVCLDELPTLYLPSLVNWLNENREDGFCGILGFQNMTQLEKAYGREIARAILTGCSSKAIFNPGEPDSAKIFSEILGEEELRIPQISRSRSQSGGSTTISNHEKTRKLFEPAQFLKLRQGRAILISPGFANATESNIPINQDIRISKNEIKLVQQIEEKWQAVRDQAIQDSGQKVPDEADLRLRREALERLIPLPISAP